MTDDDFLRRKSPPPLPASVVELLAQRKSLRARSLNDDVEEIHLKLWESPDYHKLFVPIWREDTIEGSFIADDMVAATQIRTFAVKNAASVAAGSKLAAIVRSLHVVCRRYGISRKERQGLVGGEPVSRTRDEAAE